MNLESFKAKARYAGYLLVLVSFYFLVGIFRDNLGAMQGISLTPELFGILVVLTGFHFTGNGFSSWAWFIQLKRKYREFSLEQSYCIIGVSQICKYLPGNVGHYIARMVLIPKEMKKADVAFTLFIETLGLTFTAGLIGIFYFFYFDFLTQLGGARLGVALVVGVAGLLAAFAGIKYLRGKYDFLKLTVDVYLKVIGCFVANFLLGGLTILILFNYFSGTSALELSFVQCMTGFALSFVAGFVIPGAPGGLGIREFTFVLLFSGYVPESLALEVILAFRVINLLGDILLFLVCWVRIRKFKTASASH